MGDAVGHGSPGARLPGGGPAAGGSPGAGAVGGGEPPGRYPALQGSDFGGPGGDGAELNFWRSLGQAERDALSELARPETFSPGDVLCREGDRRAKDVMVIESGWTKVSAIIHGREQIVAVRGPGDVVGERARARSARTATVTALGEVRARVLPADRFSEMLRNHPVALKIIKELQEERQAEDDARRSAPEPQGSERHLAQLLLRLALRCGGDGQSAPVTIALPMSPEDLANWANDDNAAVEGYLRAWRDSGILVGGDPGTRVFDVTKLWLRHGQAAYSAHLEIVDGAQPLRPGHPVTLRFAYRPTAAAAAGASGGQAAGPLGDVPLTVLAASPTAHLRPGLRHTVFRHGEGTPPCDFVLTTDPADGGDVELTISVYRTADSLLLQEFTAVLDAGPLASAEQGR